MEEFARTASELSAAVNHTQTIANIHLAALPPATKLEIEAALASSAARSSELVQLAENMRIMSATPVTPSRLRGPGDGSSEDPLDKTLGTYSDHSLVSTPASSYSMPSPLAVDRVALSQPPADASEADHTEWKSRLFLRLRRYLTRRLRAERDRHSKATADAEAADWAARMLEGDLLKVDLSLRQLLRVPPVEDEVELSMGDRARRDDRSDEQLVD